MNGINGYISIREASNVEMDPSGACPAGIAALLLKARVGRLFRVFRDRP